MKEAEVNKSTGYAITKINYLLIIAGFVVIIIGFMLMAGGKSVDPNEFSEEIFSFRRITLAPIVVLAGFIFEIFAIMYRPKNN
jgi:fumarate reductase subunit D